jgi:hypothetical protein
VWKPGRGRRHRTADYNGAPCHGSFLASLYPCGGSEQHQQERLLAMQAILGLIEDD